MQMLNLLHDLVEKEMFPKDWFIMRMATNQ